MKKKCPNCGSIEESRFCTNCGQDLSGKDIPVICPNCGAATTSRFCIECGTKIERDDVATNKQVEEDKIAKEREEERLARQKAEEERLAKEKAEEERLAKQKAEEERIAREKAEAERLAKQKAEEERLAKEKAEAERLAKQKTEEERLAKEKAEAERLAKQKEEEERLAKEQAVNKMREKKKYEEAISYMEYADHADDKKVAAEFYRKAEAIFENVIDYEDAEEKSLSCARKAKACEIEVESESLKEKSVAIIENAKPLNPVQNDQEIEDKDASDIKAAAAPTNKNKKGLIAALLIGALVIGGAVFAITQGKTDGSQSNSGDSTAESGSGESYIGDVIPVEDGVEIKWDNGKAVLTGYQIEKSSEEGDCVNLYFDYSKTGGDDGTFLDDLDIGVFQNGYELDDKAYLTTEAENSAYSEVKKGAEITAAKGFLLNDASELTIVLTGHDKDYNDIIERAKLTIPEDKAKDITGNNTYFADTGEKLIKNGISFKSKKEELLLTGYKWTEYDGEEMLILYFDYTNLQDKEMAMSGSDFNVKVFQKGVEQESSGWSTTTAEEHYFARVQKGKTMHCAYSYSVKDKSDIEVKITSYADDEEKTEEQVVKVK